MNSAREKKSVTPWNPEKRGGGRLTGETLKPSYSGSHRAEKGGQKNTQHTCHQEGSELHPTSSLPSHIDKKDADRVGLEKGQKFHTSASRRNRRPTNRRGGGSFGTQKPNETVPGHILAQREGYMGRGLGMRGGKGISAPVKGRPPSRLESGGKKKKRKGGRKKVVHWGKEKGVTTQEPGRCERTRRREEVVKTQ